MLDKRETEKIKKTVEEFFGKMTIKILNLTIGVFSPGDQPEPPHSELSKETTKDVVGLGIKIEEPQVLIGQQGQTLLEVQRLLRMILNKKIQRDFYLNLDINDYKRKKTEYLKDLAQKLADEVSLTKKEKELAPMPAYERRIIHSELSQRTDVFTESKGEGANRHIVIKPQQHIK